MRYLILIVWLLNMPVQTETSLDFQQYDFYIYPEERSGEWLESPLSSEWIDNRTEDIKLENKEDDG